MLKITLLLLFCVAFTSATYNYTTYVYKTIGDLKIELDVYVPPVTPPKSGYSVFFAVHGGAWIFGNKEAAFTEQELNETMRRGWVLVTIDYRLSPGVVLQGIMDDIQDAYDWVRDSLSTIIPINPDHITLFGQSAGGGLVTTAGYMLTPRPAAVISFYPAYTNWTGPQPKSPANRLIVADVKRFRTPVISNYRPKSITDARCLMLIAAFEDKQLSWLMTTEDPNLPTDKIVELLRKFSATENVDEKFPPTYLAHGLADKTVTYMQSVQLSNQLTQNNVSNVLDLVPGAGHVFDYNATYWDQHVLPAFDFAQKYMGASAMQLAYE